MITDTDRSIHEKFMTNNPRDFTRKELEQKIANFTAMRKDADRYLRKYKKLLKELT